LALLEMAECASLFHPTVAARFHPWRVGNAGGELVLRERRMLIGAFPVRSAGLPRAA
jgi:hypothetical protein